MLAAIILTHRIGSKEDIAPGKHECEKCYGDKNRLIALEEHKVAHPSTADTRCQKC